MSNQPLDSNGRVEGEKEVEEVEEGGSFDMVDVSSDDAAFDQAVGYIEDIVVGQDFQANIVSFGVFLKRKRAKV